MFNGCGMPTGGACSSGHLVPFFLGLANLLLVETNPFPNLSNYALRISLGSFLILLQNTKLQGEEEVRILNHHYKHMTRVQLEHFETYVNCKIAHHFHFKKHDELSKTSEQSYTQISFKTHAYKSSQNNNHVYCM